MHLCCFGEQKLRKILLWFNRLGRLLLPIRFTHWVRNDTFVRQVKAADSCESCGNELIHCPLPDTTSHPDSSGRTPPRRRRNVRAHLHISMTKPIYHKPNFPSCQEGGTAFTAGGVVKIASANEERLKQSRFSRAVLLF